MQTSVYWIRSKDHTDMTSQGYIGVSKNSQLRFAQHFRSSENVVLKRAIQKYGWDNLLKEVVLIAKKDYCLDIERKLRPINNVGWNIAIGGGHPPITKGKTFQRGVAPWNKGKKMSDETRQKVSKAAKEQWQRLGMRELLINAKKGKPGHRKGIKHTPETIEKMRLIKLGKPSTRKGVPLSTEIIDKIKMFNAANPWTCPHCKKIGLNKGAGTRWHFDNCKEKELCR